MKTLLHVSCSLAIALLVIGLLVLQIRAKAASTAELTLTYAGSELWSEPRHATARGNYVFCTMPYGLMIFDISDTLPHEVSRFYLPGADGVSIADGNAFVTSSDSASLIVLDVAQPSAPQVIGSWKTNGSRLVGGVTVLDDKAYLGSEAGLVILDISDRTTPRQLGVYDALGHVRDTKIVDSFAYIADGSAGLRIIDVADSRAPKALVTCKPPKPPKGPSIVTALAISGPHVYAADQASVLMFDLSDSHSSPVGHILYSSTHFPWFGQGVHDLELHGTTLLALDYGKLVAIDLVDSALSTYGDWGAYRGLDVSRDLGFLIGRDALRIFRLSDLDSSRLSVVTFPLESSPRRVALSDRFAFVADGSYGIKAIDVADPASPRVVGTCGIPGEAWDISVGSQYAYVAARDSGLQIVDISEPNNPQLAGGYSKCCHAFDVAVVGDIAYVASASCGLIVIDCSKPQSPREIGSCRMTGTARGVTVMGHLAYLACGYDGLQIVDVSNPRKPRLMGRSRKGSNVLDAEVFDVAVNGNCAYLTAAGQGVQVYDVSDPRSPERIDATDDCGPAEDIAIEGSYAFTAAGDGTVRVLDLASPTRPRLVCSYRTPGRAYGIAVSKDDVYVADECGFSVLSLSRDRSAD